MQVVEVETQEHQKRYVVIDDAGVLVEPIMRFLKYLDRIGVARNTVVVHLRRIARSRL
jgi:integrase/recombinase XerD